MVKLVLSGESGSYAKPVESGTVALGRGPNNDLVLTDGTVSWHHAVVWIEGGRTWLKDLRSTNGTFVNERQINGSEPVKSGDRIRLGDTVIIEVEGDPTSSALVDARGLVIEDTQSGVRFPVRSDRFHIGTAADADLRLAEGQDRAATLLVYTNGEIWLGIEDSEKPITVGEKFTIEGRDYVIREVVATRVATVGRDAHRYPYRLEVSLNGPMGPEAMLIDLNTNVKLKLDAGIRAVLFYLLGKKFMDNKGTHDDDRGWCTDEEVKTGIWGKHGDDNKLHVLVYRLRADLKKAGFDPWFIEKRHRHTRARLAEVVVT